MTYVKKKGGGGRDMHAVGGGLVFKVHHVICLPVSYIHLPGIEDVSLYRLFPQAYTLSGSV